jgi:hypothetical protein
MNLLYDISSGKVLSRFRDTSSVIEGYEPVPADGQAIIVVPNSVLVPDAVISVEEKDGEFTFHVDENLVQAQWSAIKTYRNQLLSDSDWICSVTDYTHPNKEGWIAYRQGLRDLSQQTNPFQLVWPVLTTPVVPSVGDPSNP